MFEFAPRVTRHLGWGSCGFRPLLRNIDRRGRMPDYHPLAEDYFNRLTAAGDTEHEPYKTAIDLLFRDLDDAGMLAKFGACQLWMGTGYAGRAVPLVDGYAVPTFFNFVEGDYDILTGLKGDGVSKYVDTNRGNAADPQNDHSMGVWLTGNNSGGTFPAIMGAGGGDTGASLITLTSNRSRTATASLWSTPGLGLVGISRAASGAYTARASQTSAIVSRTSDSPLAYTLKVFATTNNAGLIQNHSAVRVAFYWSGRAINLEAIELIIEAYAARVAAIAA